MGINIRAKRRIERVTNNKKYFSPQFVRGGRNYSRTTVRGKITEPTSNNWPNVVEIGAHNNDQKKRKFKQLIIIL